MLYGLLAITIFFVVFNLVMAEYDYMHPSFLFSLVFFVYTFVCVLCQKAYAITIRFETLSVVTIGLTVFTMVAMVSRRLRNRSKIRTHLMANRSPIFSGHYVSAKGYVPVSMEARGRLSHIHIHNGLVFIVLVLQLLCILFFIRYLHQVTIAYNATTLALKEGMVSETNLSDQIKLYDTLTKFWTETFREMNVAVPMIYRIGNPLSTAAAYILIYVLVNNFVVDRRVNPLYIVSFLLTAVLIVLNGSRSPLFRLLTMVLILFYVLNVRHGRKQSGDRKFLLITLMILLVAGAGFILMLNFMGRNDAASEKVGRYIFIYMGAPLVNLDTYLSTDIISMKDGLFGAQTFHALYSYVGKIFGIESLSYSSAGGFAFSSNGIEIGNVYTMFYKFIYDFGYAGVIPLTLLQACYYVFVYDHIAYGRVKKAPISFGLFIYSYMFNDLIMSAFSARFYETALEAPFLKLLLISYFYDLVLFRRKLRFGRYRIPLTAANYHGIKRKYVWKH